MSASAISAGRAFLQLLVDDKEFAKGLDAGVKKLEQFGNSAIRIGASLGAAGAAITAPFIGALKVFSDTGSALNDMQARTGLSAKSLSELKFAAEQTGTSLDVVEKAARKLQQDGLDPNRIFDYAKQIAAIEDPTKRAQAAMDLFGSKAGAAILPLLTDLPALQQKAQDLGLVWSEDMVKNADAFGDAVGALGSQLTQLASVIADAVAPQITDLLENTQAVVAGMIDWSKNNQAFARIALTLGAALGAVGTAITGIGVAASAAARGIGYLRTALTLLARHPWIILITVALSALAVLIQPLLEKFFKMSDANDATASSADKNASSQAKLAGAMAGTTKALSDQEKAYANLNKTEQFWYQQAQKRKQGDAEAKATSDARVASIDEKIRAINATIASAQGQIDQDIVGDAQLRDARERSGPNQRAHIERSLESSEQRRLETAGRIVKLEEQREELAKQRDELTGEAEKKRKEAADQLAEQQKKQQEELARQQEEAARLAKEARDKQLDGIKSTAASVTSQFDAFDRSIRGGTGGKLAEQIAGTSVSESREVRMLKVTEEMRGYMKDIKTSLQKSGVLLIGSA